MFVDEEITKNIPQNDNHLIFLLLFFFCNERHTTHFVNVFCLECVCVCVCIITQRDSVNDARRWNA